MRNFNRLSVALPFAAATAIGVVACGGPNHPTPSHSPKPSPPAEKCGSLAPPRIIGKDSEGHTRMQNVGNCVSVFRDGSLTEVGTIEHGETFTAVCDEEKPPVWRIETDKVMLSGLGTVMALNPQTIQQRQAGDYRSAVPVCPDPSPTTPWSFPPAA